MSHTGSVTDRFTVRQGIEKAADEPSAWSVLTNRIRNHKAIRERETEISRRLSDWLATSPPDRLSDDEIERYATGQGWEVFEHHRAERREVFEGRDFAQTFQGMIFPLIRKLIADNPDVRSVLSIGCRYAYDLHLLAQEFPQLKVSGVDLPVWTRRMNDEFPALEIHEGYALDLIKNGTAQGDIATFVSTACCFKPKELDAYMHALAATSRFVVLNELIDRLPSGKLLDPESLREAVPNIYVGAYPGLPPHFIHNYKQAAEDAGFKILHYRVFRPDWTDVYRIVMVAESARS